jgi:hypothetical protein
MEAMFQSVVCCIDRLRHAQIGSDGPWILPELITVKRVKAREDLPWRLVQDDALLGPVAQVYFMAQTVAL